MALRWLGGTAGARRGRTAAALLATALVSASIAGAVGPLARTQIAQAASKAYYSTIVAPSNPLFFFAMGDQPPTVTTSNAYGLVSNGEYCPQNGWAASPAWFTDKVSGNSPFGWSCSGSSVQPGPFPGDSEVPNGQQWTTGSSTPTNLFTDMPDYAKCGTFPAGRNTCGPGDPYWNWASGLPSFTSTSNDSLLVNFWAQLGNSTYCQTSSKYCGAPFTLWSEQWGSLPPQGGYLSVFTPDNFQHICFGDAGGGYTYTGNSPDRFDFNGLNSMPGAECVPGAIAYGNWQMVSIYFDGATKTMRLFIDGLLQGSPLSLPNWLENVGGWSATLVNNGPSDIANWGQTHQETGSASIWGYSEWYGSQAALVGNTYCGVSGNTLCPLNGSIHSNGGQYSCNEAASSMCTYLGYLYNAPGTGESPPPVVIGGPPTVAENPSGGNAAEPYVCHAQGSAGDPCNTASGTFSESFTDLSIPGRGIPLSFTRTYSTAPGVLTSPLGNGWTYNYNMSLAVNSSSGAVTISQENGAQVVFTPNGSGGFTALPECWPASCITRMGPTPSRARRRRSSPSTPQAS